MAYEESRIPSMRKHVHEAFAVCAADGEHVLDMEVLEVNSFGIVAAGVHLITYVMTSGGRKYWSSEGLRIRRHFQACWIA